MRWVGGRVATRLTVIDPRKKWVRALALQERLAWLKPTSHKEWPSLHLPRQIRPTFSLGSNKYFAIGTVLACLGI